MAWDRQNSSWSSTLRLLVGRLSLRYWQAHPVRSLVLLFIFALGLGTYLAINMANRAALSGFSEFTDTLTGQQSDWIIKSSSGYLQDADLPSLRDALDGEPAFILPVLELTATLPAGGDDSEYGRRSYQLVGLDLIALQNLPQSNSVDSAGLDFDENALFLTNYLADELDVEKGSQLELLLVDTPIEFMVAGIIQKEKSSAYLPDDLMLVDMPKLQGLSGLEGKLSRIEIIVPEGKQRGKQIARIDNLLQAWKNPGLQIATENDSRQSALTMTQAFRLNLQVLALISLLVSLYLITQAMDASVVRRRQEIGILRSLGVSPRMLLLGWFGEILVFGFVGSLLGILVGWGLAQGFVQAVAQTINALYVTSNATGVTLELVDVVTGLILGMVASLVCGLLPAYDAAMTRPAQVLRAGNESSGLRVFDYPIWGVLLVLLGTIAYYGPPLQLAGGNRFPLSGYAAAVFWILGGTIVVGSLFRPIGFALRKLGSRSLPFALTGARFRKATSRHKLAVSGLFIAIAMAGGMNVLIGSFAATMNTWIAVRFKADLFVSSEAAQSASALNRISGAVYSQILARPEVETADLFQNFPIFLEGKSTFLTGGNIPLLLKKNLLPWVVEPKADWLKEKSEGVPALVNEAFVERFDVVVGDSFEVPTFSGLQRVCVHGVYADYGNEQGSLLVEIQNSSRWFESDQITNLSLFLREGTDIDHFASLLLGRFPELSVRTNASLRANILKIFNETFAVTHAVKGIGVFVALVGLGLALISIVWENQIFLKIQHRLGMPVRMIARTVAVEGLGISLVGAVGGLLLSIPLGALLIFVVNKQSFGWTLQFVIPWGALLLLGLSVVFLGGLTAYFVGLMTVKRLAFLQKKEVASE